MMKWWFSIPFWQRVAGGFVLGVLAGWLLGEHAEKWLGPLGTVYVNLIRMIAIPLVFFAVVSAVGALHGQRSIAALSGRTFLWFAITALLAVLVAMGFGWLLKPGQGVQEASLTMSSSYSVRDVPNVLQVLINIVPENVFRALAAADVARTEDGQRVVIPSNFTILQVIFFAGLAGFALVKLGDKTRELRTLFDQAREMMIQITRFVLEMTPLGTFGLIAALVGTYGFAQLLPLGKFVIALYLACAFHIVVVYTGLLLAHGLNPLKFFRGAAPAMQVAFVASSSFAALPLSLSSATHNLGVNKDYASFAVPLGASIKMDGCGAIYPVLSAFFIAQFTGIELTTSQYIIIMLASVLGSFGTAGVPGTAVIMATVVVAAAGLPLHTIGFLYAIDRVLDMMRTMTNVTGQVLVPVLVAKQTGLLDEEVYARASSNVGVEHNAP